MSIFYDPYADTQAYRRNLPHWAQDGKLHFVTFRLADSIPVARIAELEAERSAWKLDHLSMKNAADWIEYYRLFSDRVEGWLDDNVGECLLARPQCAEVIAQSLRHYDRDRYSLDHWVIMPNHVHVLVLKAESHQLEDILHGWKSFSARYINKLSSRTGQLWQHESFDHIVRSQSQLENFRRYIVENASQAHALS
jgi:REP element-mobilizing transposase RayT